jgi:hypothetical protein
VTRTRIHQVTSVLFVRVCLWRIIIISAVQSCVSKHGRVWYLGRDFQELAVNSNINVLFGVNLPYYFNNHVGWVSCHHGMARPQVADGGKSSTYGG